LRGTSRFGFAGVPNAPNIELSQFKHKERARVTPLRFSWALIEQRKRNKPPLRNWLGSLAAIGLVLARCARCSVGLGAVQCCALCSAGRSKALGAVSRRALCSAARCICAVLKANASAHTLGSVSSRFCTGSASLNAAQYPRLPLRSASPAKGLLPRARNAVQC